MLARAGLVAGLGCLSGCSEKTSVALSVMKDKAEQQLVQAAGEGEVAVELYRQQYADLKVHEEYEWKLGTMLVFDTQRWHSSSWFLSAPALQDEVVEYKRSIVAFGNLTV
jgi:hypothetical protein